MPIPTTRAELVDLVTSTYDRLHEELESAPAKLGSQSCVDDWTVKELLAVRLWWSERVVDWIEIGRDGETPELPAEGYRWNETPRLNNDIAARSKRESYRSIRTRLQEAYERVLLTIDALDDHELLDTGHFPWADKWPIARWISINTARQYATARTYIRRAKRNLAKQD